MNSPSGLANLVAARQRRRIAKVAQYAQCRNGSGSELKIRRCGIPSGQQKESIMQYPRNETPEQRKQRKSEEAAYAAQRREGLSRFLNEINSDKKPSEAAISWWLGQY